MIWVGAISFGIAGVFYLIVGCAMVAALDKPKIVHPVYLLVLVPLWPVVVVLSIAMAFVRMAWWMAHQR